MKQKEQTFGMIKPNVAVRQEAVSSILSQIQKAGFTIVEMKKEQMEMRDAVRFYEIHSGKPFFEELCLHITSGPVIGMLLEKENAVDDFRALIGHTDPVKANAGTLRKQFGSSLGENGLHGSDALTTAQKEINFFFDKKSCHGRCACR